jgi:hypothetical protein
MKTLPALCRGLLAHNLDIVFIQTAVIEGDTVSFLKKEKWL